MLKKLVSKIRKEGVSKTCATVVNKLELLWLKRRCLKVFKGLRGIEIGGPSQLFSREGLLPVYEIAGSVDGCNYSADTLWTGNIPEGETYKYLDDKPHGHQYICDATKLDKIPSDTYDFLLSSHVLEHVPDDRRAMREFHRVLKKDGWAILLVPITAKSTFEDPSITDPRERLRLFGQEDHVRQYGPDYKDRLEQAGFNVEQIRPADFLSPAEIKKMAIIGLAGDIYFCRRQDASALTT